MFGKRLRKVRISKGISQRTLATKIGVPPQNISEYERGIVQPRDERIKELANALGVSYEELKYGVVIGMDDNELLAVIRRNLIDKGFKIKVFDLLSGLELKFEDSEESDDGEDYEDD